MRPILTVLTSLSLLFPTLIPGKIEPEVRFEGLRIWVTDLEEARKFYEGLLGFQMEEQSKESAILNTGSFPIHLSKSAQSNGTDYEKHERTALSIQVSKLLPAIDALRAKGVNLLEGHLQRNGVGISIPFKDPFGNLLSLIEVQIREVPAFEGFQIYNTGITSGDMDKAISFYEGILGFEEWSRDYLPQAMPLKHKDQSFAFMLHYKAGLAPRSRKFGTESEINLLFSSSDLSKTISGLKQQGVEMVSVSKTRAAFKDPFGNICELVEK